MTAVHDETVQSQELVWIMYNMKKGPNQDQESVQSASQIMLMEAITRHRRALPIRCTWVHSCSNDPCFLLAQAHIETQVHGRSEHEAYHTHQVESPQDCAVKLESFGIPARALPISSSVDMISLGSHNEWLRCQAHKEMNEALKTSPFYQQLQKDRMMDLLEPTPISSSSEISMVGAATSVVSLASPVSFTSRGAVAYQPSSLGTIQEGFQQISRSRYNSLGDHRLSPFQVKNSNDAKNCTTTQHSVYSSLVAPSLTKSDLSRDSCTPRKFDVLFGRGKVKDHPGNIELHKLISMNQARYDSAERWEKTVIAEDIVSSIRQLDGRFLKLLTGHNQQRQPQKQWVEVDPDTAREKVSHTFRSNRTKIMKISHGSSAKKAAPAGR